MAADLECHACGSRGVRSLPEYANLCRVTSDCKPWPRGGRIGVCRACGTIQKALDHDWWLDADRIYREYTIYYQSDGAEQAVFSPVSGQSASRSRRLLERLLGETPFPDTGRLLDIGCGNGALLRAFSRLKPGWRLAGSELSDKYRSLVEQIPGVSTLHVCPPEQIPDSFNVVSLIHALEHIYRPVEFLRRLHDHLLPDGRLIIEVPDVAQNPFDLLVADHASHFTKETAAQALRLAGYQIETAATDWVPKELTFVARAEEAAPAGVGRQHHEGVNGVRRQLQWLHRVVSAARAAASAAGGEGRLGIFGTSITATWLVSELGGDVGFFVDEDPNRIGREFMGKPIFHPRQVASESQVFLALPPAVAGTVRGRLEADGVRFTCHVPPPFAREGESAGVLTDS